MTGSAFLAQVPSGCRERLTAHYGSAAAPWLDEVPRLLEAAARQWGLTLTEFHDAGHASVLAMAADPRGKAVVLKAWFDPERHQRELAALRLWYSGVRRVVLASDPAHAVAALRLVGTAPGGSPPPDDELAQVAKAITALHSAGRRSPGRSFPLLDGYLAEEVLPRIRRRTERRTGTRFADHAADVLPLLGRLPEGPAPRTVLHADLYRENIAFDVTGKPVLLDPLPMRGDTLFDWAFWCVYYRLGRGAAARLRLAGRHSGTAPTLLLPWCLMLALDGLLYYEESGDRRLHTMARLFDALLEQLRRDQA
ncbi:phosphotransferase [Streptomyces sp. NPDC092296]|uniref:phosphotransferase n=1 Tax=Streptomyces sp. NPDC092296 TaxID=3366012 RepID=UPI0038063F1E